MSAPKILVVEDDTKTAQTIRLYLEHAGFEVKLIDHGVAGLAAARSGGFDLLILDLLLPGLSGTELCRALRRESQLPIIMLTAKAAEVERVHGLDLGADDYVTKPFSPRELVARVTAVLRRNRGRGGAEQKQIRQGDLLIDISKHRVYLSGQSIELTTTEFKLLTTLAGSCGRVFSREELIDRVFGFDFDGTDRTVDAHVKNLRKKIEPDRNHPQYVQTIVGTGYRFKEQ